MLSFSQILYNYYLIKEYEIILLFICIAIGLSLIILALSYILVYQNIDSEKLSSYECGFIPFDDARQKFDVRFYLVSILFIIFDLEIAFLFPWSVTLSTTGLYGFVIMMIFLIILTIGFIYEWIKGALDWE